MELGCGSAGVYSMISVPFADVVISTDTDTEALKLLHENVSLNVDPGPIQKMVIKRLTWGNKDDVMVIKELGNFEIIVGTDVTYYAEAISPLFDTASDLIAKGDGRTRPALILCHIQRRVDEGSIVTAASRFGFKLVDRWFNGMNPNGGIIGSWFSGGTWMSALKKYTIEHLVF